MNHYLVVLEKPDYQYCHPRVDIDIYNLFCLELYYLGIGRSCRRFTMGRFGILELNE